jgi:lipid II:glycine glycyltransferase (peptidoglycan interpeptide bridge formation enzyme)
MKDKESHDLEEIIKKQKTRIGELEGELSIVKGIGMNSPEMRAAKTRIEELERDREILKQDIDRLSEYNQNLETMLRTKND